NIEEVNVIIANIEHADNVALLKNQDGNVATPTNNTDNVKTEMKSGAQNVNKNVFEKDEQYNIKNYLRSVEPNLIDDPNELKNISYRYCNDMKSFNMFEYFRKNNKNVIIALQRIFICMQMYSLVLCAIKGKEFFEQNMSSNFDQSFFKEKENSNVFCDCKKKYYQNKYDISENYKKKENVNLYPNCYESLQKNSFTSTIATAVEGARPNIIPSNTTLANDIRNTEGNTLFYQNYNNVYNNENEPAINKSENNTVPPVCVNNIQREEKHLMINGKDTICINNKNNMNNCINCSECMNEINFFNYNNSKESNDDSIKYFSNLDVHKKMCLYYYKSTLFYNNVYSEDNHDNYSFSSNQNNRLTSVDSTGKSSSDEFYNSNNMPYYTLNIYNKEDNYLNLFKPLLPNIKPLLFSLNKILFNQYRCNEPINTIHEQLFNHIVCDIAKDKIKLNRKIKEIKKMYLSNNENHNLCKCTNYSKQENNKNDDNQNCNNTDCIRNSKRYKKAKLKIKHLIEDLKHIRTFEKLCYELFNLKNKSETETYSSDINKCDMMSDYNEGQNFNSNNDSNNYTSLKNSPKNKQTKIGTKNSNDVHEQKTGKQNENFIEKKTSNIGTINDQNKTEKNQKECNMLTPNRDENKNVNNNIDSSGGAGESSGNAGTTGTLNNNNINNISGLRKESDNNYLNKNKNIDDLIRTMINKKKKSFYKNFITCEKDIYKTIEKSSFTEIPYVLFFYMNCFKNLKRGELIDIPLYLDIYEDKEDDEVISNGKNGKDRNKNAQTVTHNNCNNVKEEKGPYYFGIKKNIRKKSRNDDYNEEDIITYHLYALVISENKDINNMSMPNYNKLNDLELNTINDFNFNSYSYLILRPYIKGPWYKIYKNRITKLTQKCEFNEWKCHKDFYCSSCIYISESYYDNHNKQFLKQYNIKDINFPLYIHTLKEFDIEEKDIYDFNKQINTDINTLLLDKNHEKIDDELVYELRKMENITPPKPINTQISNQNKIIPQINNKFENEAPKQSDDIYYDHENEQNVSKSNENDIDNVCSS
ncbi:RNA pseudouridylate synthase, putative, partial [Plasmodium ovale curtisi]